MITAITAIPRYFMASTLTTMALATASAMAWVAALDMAEAVGAVRAVLPRPRPDPLFLHGVEREGLFTAALDCLYPGHEP